jgi:hypothetical protein
MLFEYRHPSSVALRSPTFRGAMGRKQRTFDERFWLMLRRRRQTKKLRTIARVLCELEAAGPKRHPASARKGDRASLGRAA